MTRKELESLLLKFDYAKIVKANDSLAMDFTVNVREAVDDALGSIIKYSSRSPTVKTLDDTHQVNMYNLTRKRHLLYTRTKIDI